MRATGTVRQAPYGSQTAMARIGTHCPASIREVGGSIDVTSTSGLKTQELGEEGRYAILVSMRPSALEQEVLAFDIAQLPEASVEYVPDLGGVGAKGGDPMDRSRLLREGAQPRAGQDDGAAGEGEDQVTGGDDVSESDGHAAGY